MIIADSKKKYIYTFVYDNTASDLCKLESRCMFEKEEKNKVLISDIKAEPSRSAFIKNRIDVILFSTNYDTLISEIKNQKIKTDGFKVEYVVLPGDETKSATRLQKMRDVGYSIDTFPDYYNPTIVYVICQYKAVWYFGVRKKNNLLWQKHKQKPRSFSNSIKMNIAKALVNIAAQSNTERKLLDACCGVGTIMLEACFSGIDIDGCDINWKAYKGALENLAHFNYKAKVFHLDIADICQNYDAVILDLPYNLYSTTSDLQILNIIKAATEIANRLVIVSISDLSSTIAETGFIITDHCIINKRGKSKFGRRIWVCEGMTKDV